MKLNQIQGLQVILVISTITWDDLENDNSHMIHLPLNLPHTSANCPSHFNSPSLLDIGFPMNSNGELPRSKLIMAV